MSKLKLPCTGRSCDISIIDETLKQCPLEAHSDSRHWFVAILLSCYCFINNETLMFNMLNLLTITLTSRYLCVGPAG